MNGYCSFSGKVCFTKRDAETSRNLRSSGRKKIGWKAGAKTPGRTGRSRKNTYREMRIYPCPNCNYWHLTHKI